MLKVYSLLVVLLTTSVLACPTGTKVLIENEEKFCLLKGKYLNSSLNLTSDFVYRLDSEGVFFGGDNKSNSTLRIQAGTKIVGEPKSFLVMMRGSKIFAEGTQKKPIVFTSIKSSNRKRGEWGGLVLSGNAPINACKQGTPLCEAVSEGISVEQVKFGGNDPQDNSGVLKYVRLEYTGYPIAQDNELNGLSLNAVGENTEIDFVQVHMSADDGIEVFGGNVNLKHIVLTNNDDDSLDWDFGWQGKVQYLVVSQADDSGDNGFEGDNLKSPMNAEPRSNPIMSNVTLLGGKNGGYGMLLRRGTSAQIQNSIVTNFRKACVNIVDAETFNHGGLKIENTIFSCTKNADELSTDPWSTENWLKNQSNHFASPALVGFYPTNDSPALGKGITLDDLFFEPVDYLGAFSSEDDKWESGWTSMSKE